MHDSAFFLAGAKEFQSVSLFKNLVQTININNRCCVLCHKGMIGASAFLSILKRILLVNEKDFCSKFKAPKSCLLYLIKKN